MASYLAVVVPGEVITSEAGYLRGHGTFIKEGDENHPQQLVAAVAGVVERVNKLISVRPVKSRYIGEVGDLVVGRISEVGPKRWKVDVAAHKDATLMLSSVNLPGGAQRIRTYEDQLQMRTFFKENDLISAEVQQVNQDGSVALHTRSLKYGKLENGRLLKVPQVLVRRLKQHFITLPDIKVDVILGNNGYIWVTRSTPSGSGPDSAIAGGGAGSGGGGGTASVDAAMSSEVMLEIRKRHAETPVCREDREKICRVTNAIGALRHVFTVITPDTIMLVYNRSLERGLVVKDMLKAEEILALTEPLMGNR